MLRVLVVGRYRKFGSFVNCWVPGSDVGSCVDSAVALARAQFRLTKAVAHAVEWADGRCIPKGAPTYEHPKRGRLSGASLWPLSESPLPFAIPHGVVGAFHRGRDPELREGYTWERTDGGWRLVCAVDRSRIMQLWRGLVRIIPATDNVEVTICPDSIGKKDLVSIYLSPPLKGTSQALRLTTGCRLNLFDNGFVELAIYCRGAKATLRLDDHKVIYWYVQRRSMYDPVERFLHSQQVPLIRKLPRIALAHHHYHYRRQGAACKEELVVSLERDSFKKVHEFKVD